MSVVVLSFKVTKRAHAFTSFFGISPIHYIRPACHRRCMDRTGSTSNRVEVWLDEAQLDRAVVTPLVSEVNRYPKTKRFVMLVGFSKAGKETLARSHPLLGSVFTVSTDRIHDLLHQAFPMLRDDWTWSGKAFEQRQEATRLVRERIVGRALQQRVGIVSDSANLSLQKRASLLQLARRHDYRTSIVWVVCGERELTRRLRQADQEQVANGNLPTWVELYRRVQRRRFDPPALREADDVYVYNSEVDDPTLLDLH